MNSNEHKRSFSGYIISFTVFIDLVKPPNTLKPRVLWKALEISFPTICGSTFSTFSKNILNMYILILPALCMQVPKPMHINPQFIIPTLSYLGINWPLLVLHTHQHWFSFVLYLYSTHHIGHLCFTLVPKTFSASKTTPVMLIVLPLARAHTWNSVRIYLMARDRIM